MHLRTPIVFLSTLPMIFSAGSEANKVGTDKTVFRYKSPAALGFSNFFARRLVNFQANIQLYNGPVELDQEFKTML